MLFEQGSVKTLKLDALVSSCKWFLHIIVASGEGCHLRMNRKRIILMQSLVRLHSHILYGLPRNCKLGLGRTSLTPLSECLNVERCTSWSCLQIKDNTLNLTCRYPDYVQCAVIKWRLLEVEGAL